jgi:hypothetical protein
MNGNISGGLSQSAAVSSLNQNSIYFPSSATPGVPLAGSVFLSNIFPINPSNPFFFPFIFLSTSQMAFNTAPSAMVFLTKFLFYLGSSLVSQTQLYAAPNSTASTVGTALANAGATMPFISIGSSTMKSLFAASQTDSGSQPNLITQNFAESAGTVAETGMFTEWTSYADTVQVQTSIGASQPYNASTESWGVGGLVTHGILQRPK